MDAVIVSTARTPIGKAYTGALNDTHGAGLGGHAIRHAVERAGIDPAEVEDVILGAALVEGATGANIARQAAIRAGLPVSVSAATVCRNCSSGLQTIAMAAHEILHEGLGALQLRAILRRTNYRHIDHRVRFYIINHTFHQWLFRTHHQ